MVEVRFLANQQPAALYPLTVLNRAEELTWGVGSLAEVWRHKGQTQVPHPPILGHEIHVLPSLRPSSDTFQAILEAGPGIEWTRNGVVWARSSAPGVDIASNRPVPEDWSVIARPQDFFLHAAAAIDDSLDFAQSAWNLRAPELPSHVTVIGPAENLHVATDATLTACTLNTTGGPIVIGPGAEIEEGAHIRGPFMLGSGSTVKMGARIYGPTIIGPHCKVGGEVSNSVFLGYSNKGHDGFLGNSVLGFWCNLGADTNTSNLKNTYGEVSVFNGATGTIEPSGLQFCGLIMGDHSKCGINTMFNTGTVVGVGTNIFGGGFPPKHVPSFSWGGADSGWTGHDIEKMISTARAVMARRNVELSADAEDRIRQAHAAVSSGAA